jgi:formimidoylglutamate deiminase
LLPDAQDPALRGVPTARALDSLVFSSPGRPWSDVMVAGRWVVRDGRHPRANAIAREYDEAMAPLWQAD